ncbi:outer membrane protein [Xanthobacter sediminis]
MNKKLLANALAMMVVGSPALAADLSTKAPAAAPSAPAWTGFYIGLNAGYGWGTGGNAQTASIPVMDAISTDPWWGTPPGFTALANSGTANISQSGFVAGIQAGYDYQVSPNIVAGIEADLQGSGIGGTGSSTGIAQYGPDLSALTNTAVGEGLVTANIDWLGTVRARLGYLVTPTLMVYGTGGLAYGHVTASAANSLSFTDNIPEIYPTFGGGGGYSSTRVGWTAGGGGEWLVAPNWSVRAEALYYNLGSGTFASSPVGAIDPDGDNMSVSYPGAVLFANSPVTRVTYDGVIARAGISYRFNGTAAPAATAASAPAKWTGPYAGLNAGYGWSTGGSASTTAIPLIDNIATDPIWGTPFGFTAAASSGTAQVNQSGFTGGAQVGYDYQIGPNVIAGIEADIQGSAIAGSGSYTGIAVYGPDAFGDIDTARGAGTVTVGLDWLGTVRGRLGYLATPTLMVYATGGLAYGGVTATTSQALGFADDEPEFFPTFGGTRSQSSTRVGWSAGGGGEWLLAPNWSVKAEALYYDLGSQNVASNPVGAVDPDGGYLAAGVPGAVLFANAPVTRVKYDGVIARLGVNYRFDWGAL